MTADGGVHVPFLDLAASYRELKDEIDAAHARVMASGWYLLGDELAAFEHDLAAYVGANHAVGVGSGFDALTLALRALGVGPGDDVLVPGNTYVATWFAVSAVGARPVAVEPDPLTHNIDVSGIEAAMTARTKVILPVHLYGQPVDLDPILALARARGLKVVEDAAQAHGARYRGRPIGAAGDAVCWSFYPSKNLGAFGDGGAVTTDDDELAGRVRVLGNGGSPRKYVHTERGVSSRLDELQAAVLRVKLTHLDEWNARRAAIAARYLEALRELPLFGAPTVVADVSPAWHLFVVRHGDRDGLRRELDEAGIETQMHYPVPPYRQPAYADLAMPRALPVSDQLAGEVLSLPMGPHLGRSQVDAVLAALIRAGASEGDR